MMVSPNWIAPLLDVAGPGLMLGMLALAVGALVLLFLLIVVIESAALQLLSWDTFRRCMRASFWMNLASTLVGFLFLTQIPRFGLAGLVISMLLTIGIEGLVLNHLIGVGNRRNWLAAVVTNLASYFLIIFPTYLFSQ
ncbi:MAG: hypothetical protein JXB15_18000 [Anaerolineales bacterium]|nr:hypothetical protein [Anaerolineales bacterium]